MKAGLILLLGLLTGSYQQLGPYENNWLSHLPVDGYYDSAEPRQEPVGPLSYVRLHLLLFMFNVITALDEMISGRGGRQPSLRSAIIGVQK